MLFINDDGTDANGEGIFDKRRMIFSHVQPNMTFYNTTTTTTMPPIMIDGCDISRTGTTENISYAIFMVLVLIASIFGNSLVLMAFALSKQLRNRVTVYFIVSLACSDMAYAIFQIPFNISMKLYMRFCHDMPACYLMVISDSFCNVASILNLFLIAVDRFIAIRMPFRYTSMLSKSRAKKLIAGVWIFSAIWSISGLFTWRQDETSNTFLSVHLSAYCLNKNYYFYATSFIGIYLLSLIIMTVTYLIILHVALVQIREIEATHVDLQRNEHTIPSPELTQHLNVPNTENARYKKSQKRKRRRELKATKSVAIVYFAFLVCWLPSCVVNVIIMFNTSYFPKLRQKHETLFLFIYYCFIQILPIVNTMVNPIIYSFANQQFRHGFRSVYNKIMRKLDVPTVSFESTRRNTRGSSLGSFSQPTGSSQYSESSSSRKQSRSSPVLLKKTSLDQTNFKGTFLNNNIDRGTNKNSMANTVIIWSPD